MRRQIAYVEDDPVILANYTEMLSAEGFDVLPFGSKEDALTALQDNLPDLALLDVSLHGERDAGFDLCAELRRLSGELPVIFLTSHDGEFDKISGLRIGADDYICKPFSPREVVARVKAVLRRAGNAAQPPAEGGLALDRHRFEAVHDGARVALTAIEFELLAALSRQAGRIWTRDQLMDVIYSDHRVVSDRTIDSHIRKLRRKLSEGLTGDHDWIGSVYGVGYRLQNPDEEA